MKKFREYITDHKEAIAMIHVQALPGAPGNRFPVNQIIDQAVKEARLYQRCGFKTVMIENMHDIPYTRQVGPEITAVMAVIASHIRQLGLYCGVQVLAACNREALAVALASGADFVRVEGFVFGHVADEGYIDACAGEIMRYRRQIGAEDVLVLADIKKKHSSHAVTADVSVAETAKAAAFFGVDGVIVTGSSTGTATDVKDLRAIEDLSVLKAVGSGLTSENIFRYMELADLFIIGSSLKINGNWQNEPDKMRVSKFFETFSGDEASL